MSKLPIAQLPDIVPPQVNVAAVYTGAEALTIEQSVATPLEQQMNGVDNMLYMLSTNANDGTMNLKVSFDIGTNVDIDQVNTQNRVSQASPNLPTSVNQYGVTVKKLMGLRLLVISLAFILGCVPLWMAKGAGAIGRKVLGSSVITGMGAASILGIFLVPVLFVVIERIAGKKKKETVAVPSSVALEGGHD